MIRRFSKGTALKLHQALSKIHYTKTRELLVDVAEEVQDWEMPITLADFQIDAIQRDQVIREIERVREATGSTWEGFVAGLKLLLELDAQAD